MDLLLSEGVLPLRSSMSSRALYDLGIRGQLVEVKQTHVLINIVHLNYCLEKCISVRKRTTQGKAGVLVICYQSLSVVWL